MRLPAELRNEIYRYVFSGLNIYVLIHFRKNYRIHFQTAFPPKTNAWWNSSQTLLALTQTCRQTHSETSLYPFSLNVFDVQYIDAFREFVRSLLPSQRSAIAAVTIDIEYEGDLMSLARWGAIEWDESVTTLEQLITPVLNELPGLKQLTIEDHSNYGIALLPRGSCAELGDVELRIVGRRARR